MHAVAFFKMPIEPIVLEALDWFPGVPIFFVISGYLVVASFVNTPAVKEFLRNRALRIFPGLWVCLSVSYLFVWLQGGLSQNRFVEKTIIWALTQGSFFQFLNFVPNPGVVNGALWSISTELQFYLLIPVLFSTGWIFKGRLKTVTLILICVASASAFIHAWMLENMNGLLPRAFPTIYASIFSNGYFFCFGVVGYMWRERLIRLVSGRAFHFLLFYILIRFMVFFLGISANRVHSTMLSLLIYPVLALVVFSLAYSNKGMANKLLAGNDFSYGIYIYHMPVIYMLLYFGFSAYMALGILLVSVASLATASWFLVESPALRLKHHWSYSICQSEGQA